ncbi:MAG: formamidopyrimidine-DNA glycosylase [uncultured bacterium]|uniref:Formamidopyrimidine-DNA glycosylase n=1 Tax=Candidatus Daviesbacteria bacterium GW2011_GWC2_40_12 TaxID=1618431 RepID=A0A0G0TWA6_9BACT|nr:MAG: formamidopyrimidine-DNA glycosylase [uncultured bacterium]KKQ84570.1 MAG: formamidopyrimidine-DNA glycosylase [Candidatus Daviesbacteria bacterium GW2011_GWF2_38_7]KKR16384.1 MAG: formamidopyrimidine-DNA glycosylase [Candidatus Daviesbacteria bacterium GW2011_GWA2_39_33]KKR42242.1 MAG: formamidopyrimidine-DNA glycosylase [Candidatus Daviesbacteria bacterium GW2011_GWC2_40_12]OGE21986.1 MAG: DNA-formamidopyrimidine glycosylase [Candidatus Daviesbacteria bacterium RIFCSPHIGHO2_01_FULL_40_
MPELPEVEVIRLGLTKKIIGLKIQKIQILSPKSFIGNPNLAQGKNVLKIWRRAKLLGIDLVGEKLLAIRRSLIAKSKKLTANSEQQITLLFHLKMSGQLIYIPSEKRIASSEKRFIGGHPTEDMLGTMPNPHTRVIFTFSNNSHLYFNDQRRFGWVKVIDNGQLAIDNSLKNLGPEPLEKGFTWEVLKQNLLRHKSMPVKVAIMDQSAVSGIGNIYSNEACFNAKIDPRTKVGDLTDKQFKSLFEGIIKALKEGIKRGGSTRAHFVDPEGHKGYFLDYAYVYWRDKHPCKMCKTEIKKIALAGRGTYFCLHCQK